MRIYKTINYANIGNTKAHVWTDSSYKHYNLKTIEIHNDIKLLKSIASLITMMLSQTDRLSTYQPISRQPALAPFL